MRKQFVAIVLITAFALVSKAASPVHYEVKQKFTLGGDGGWDYLTFDPAGKRLFISRGTRVMVIDPYKGSVITEIKSEMTSMEARKGAVANTWPVAGCEEPSGLAIDQKNRRLFPVCGNKVMAVVNADNGKVITTMPIGQGVDAAGFDPNTGL